MQPEDKFLHCEACDAIVRHTLNEDGKYACQGCGHVRMTPDETAAILERAGVMTRTDYSDTGNLIDVILRLQSEKEASLMSFTLDDVKAQLKDAADEPIEITNDVLRRIWYEVHTESIVSQMNDLIYDACIDYLRGEPRG